MPNLAKALSVEKGAVRFPGTEKNLAGYTAMDLIGRYEKAFAEWGSHAVVVVLGDGKMIRAIVVGQIPLIALKLPEHRIEEVLQIPIAAWKRLPDELLAEVGQLDIRGPL